MALSGGVGLDANGLFNTPCMGYGLDDLVCVPSQCKDLAAEVDLSARFSRNVLLSCPIVSAPMDTVTESRMAIACALAGGMGVLHGGCSAQEQAREVEVVKRFDTGFIMDPHVLGPGHTVNDLDRLRGDGPEKGAVLVCEGGLMGNKLLGIVTSRDVDFVEDRSARLADVMTPKAKMLFEREPISLSKANADLRASKKGKLPILNEAGELVALVSRSNLKKSQNHPLAARDANRQLLVAAACSASPESADRVKMLVEAGVDALVVTASPGSSVHQVDFVKRVKDHYPNLDVVCGNVVVPRQAKPLLDAGADGLRVGSGSSSLFSTEAAVGRPQGSAVYHTARFAAEQRGVPVIADGGVNNSAQAAMALSLGASTVMCSSLLAGASEAPGEAFYHEGQRMKTYRGMGGVDAHGAGCPVLERGSAGRLLPSLSEGIRRELTRLGVSSIEKLHEGLHAGSLRFQTRR